MYTQFLLTNFTREIQKCMKLTAVRQPIAQKFYLYACTLAEMIKWDELTELCETDNQFQKKARLLMTTLVKLLDYTYLPLNRLQEFDEVTWFQVKALLPENMKAKVFDFLTNTKNYPLISELEA